MNLSTCRAVIVVLIMDDCPYCDEYKPRLESEIARWQAKGWPFVVVIGACPYCDGRSFEPGQIPIVILNSADPHEHVQMLQTEQHVEGLPTTLLYLRDTAPQKQEGALEDAEIYQLLKVAAGR